MGSILGVGMLLANFDDVTKKSVSLKWHRWFTKGKSALPKASALVTCNALTENARAIGP